MRVTGGVARGVPLRSPRRPGVRPTMDRVRNALFSILAPFDLEHAQVADLFAGTGTLGIEALSRGAQHADFVEMDVRQCANIEANLKATALQDRATIHRMTVERALQSFAFPYDLVLMDPPYSQPFPFAVLEQLEVRSLLSSCAIVVVGHSSRVSSPAHCGGLIRRQDRRYGDASLAFYTQQMLQADT